MRTVSVKQEHCKEYEQKTTNVCSFWFTYLAMFGIFIYIITQGYLVALVWVIICPIQLISVCCLKQAENNRFKSAFKLACFFYPVDKVLRFQDVKTTTVQVDQHGGTHTTETIETSLYQKIGKGIIKGLFSFLLCPVSALIPFYCCFSAMCSKGEDSKKYSAPANTQTTQNS